MKGNKKMKQEITRWISPSENVYLTRDAKPSEQWMFPMMAKRWRKGSRDEPQNCAVFYGVCDWYGFKVEQAIELGMWVGKQIAIFPFPDKTVPNGWIRLRFRHDGKLVKAFDDGKPKEGNVVFHGMSPSQRLETKRAYSAGYRQRKARRASKPTHQIYQPIRGGVRAAITRAT